MTSPDIVPAEQLPSQLQPEETTAESIVVAGSDEEQELSQQARPEE